MPLQDIEYNSAWKEDFGMVDIGHEKKHEEAMAMPAFGIMDNDPEKTKKLSLWEENLIKQEGYVGVLCCRVYPNPDGEKPLQDMIKKAPEKIEWAEKKWLVCGFLGARLHLKHKSDARIKYEIESKLKRLFNSAYLKGKRLSFAYRRPWKLHKDADFETEYLTYKISGRLTFVLEKNNAITGY